MEQLLKIQLKLKAEKLKKVIGYFVNENGRSLIFHAELVFKVIEKIFALGCKLYEGLVVRYNLSVPKYAYIIRFHTLATTTPEVIL